ncbi:2-amino-4-hydroxy-6-hydroxymethyldihydropteridine diphosphokinase [Achromobacter sp. GG226]|uniref:2-amino-4-hydroxy-6- hydroxymethyldihydropteridine diphosphokinase n=1 Tax=Verticiella alkaliphila TaxID=2779529 RepID=UPI001C0E7CA5|nr:2-amino-4-hydroxy-6-hydroxymethyldihydropteridine diphosphokinase [Verticiella sp. GG226]MBU4611033.1 2-amino-4-hydroxy-6-hydroxymethyldihydropteridine diphosphokinase [Verticiella sp. GG226]
MTSPIEVYIGIGGNLGDALATVRAAIAELRSAPGLSAVTSAALYRSAPVEASGPDFINTVVRASTTLAPLALLDLLQAIEARHGRERPYRNAPRTLDLDLLLYGDIKLDTPRLTLPHPRMTERAFVLAPLAELAPALRVPAGTVSELLAALDQRIERLPVPPG